MAHRIDQRPPVPPLDNIPEEEEELEPLFSEDQIAVFQTIAQLAFRIIFSVGVTFMVAAAALPLAFQAVAIAVGAIGSSFLAAFFFNPDNFYVAPLLPKQPVGGVQNAPPAAAPRVAPPPLAPEVPRGYRNQTGVDCWLASCMQLIDSDPGTHQWIRNPLPPFVAPLPYPGQNQAQYDRYVADKRDEYQQFAPVHQAFQQFAQQHDAAVQQGAPVSGGSTRALRQAIHRTNFRIERGARQEDPHEGITNVLQMLPIEQKIRLRQFLHLEYPVQEAPDGISITDDYPDWSIPLAITGLNPNLPDMLHHHLDERIYDHAPNDRGIPENSVKKIGLDGVERWVPFMRKRWELIEPPPMLRFQIVRFENRKKADTWLNKIPLLNYFFPSRVEYEQVKNETPVLLPLEMDVPIGNGDRQQKYKLRTFSLHLGSAMRSGHYIAYVLKTVNGVDQWYCCNDSNVSPVDQREVDRVRGTGAPYMVWYERV